MCQQGEQEVYSPHITAVWHCASKQKTILILCTFVQFSIRYVPAIRIRSLFPVHYCSLALYHAATRIGSLLPAYYSRLALCQQAEQEVYSPYIYVIWLDGREIGKSSRTSEPRSIQCTYCISWTIFHAGNRKIVKNHTVSMSSMKSTTQLCIADTCLLKKFKFLISTEVK
jgi:hypothetical protein